MSAHSAPMLPSPDTLGQFELPTVTGQHITGPASRRDGAYGLPRATEFSDDRDLMNPRWVVRQMKRIRELWAPVRAATARQYGGENPRGYEDGDWAHVFAVFTMSDTPYLATFWEAHQESSLWQEAGFPVVPAYTTMETNFRHLERCAPVIEAAAYKLMRWAEQCDPRVNQDWHVDGTAYHSAAQLQHCCPDPRACRAAGGRPPKFVPKLPDQTVKEKRHAVQRSEETKTRTEDEVEDIRDLRPGELAGFEPDPRYRYQWLNVAGGRHLYRSLDRDAATRAYKSGRRRVKAWHGGIALASVDNFTGAMNGILFFPADEQEYDHYPALHAKVAAGIGHEPRAMLADRGLHTQSVFEFNTRRGTATIIPWREPAPGRRRRDMRSDEFDEHGVPRCKYCGGSTTQDNTGGGALARRQTLGFYLADNGDPRLRFICALGTTDRCRAHTQSISCSKEWRMLLPIGLTSELYYALKGASKNKENIFYAWRQRYNVAANDKSSRQRVRRRAHLELRAAFGLLIEWFRVCVRHRWLHIPDHNRANGAQPYRRSGRLWLDRVLRSRARRGVAVPYGRYAERAGMVGLSLTLPGHDPPGPDAADHPPQANDARPF